MAITFLNNPPLPGEVHQRGRSAADSHLPPAGSDTNEESDQEGEALGLVDCTSSLLAFHQAVCPPLPCGAGDGGPAGAGRLASLQGPGQGGHRHGHLR